MSEKTLLKLNRLFRRPEHPFNTEAAGGLSYAEWEFQRAPKTLALFEPEFSPGEILGPGHDRVLDLGCGAGGKSVYYAMLGAQVTGVDLVKDYRSKAEALAAEKSVRGLAGPGQEAGPGSFTFVCADAANTGLPDASFDTIIASDAMEHFPDPEGVLRECARLLRPGGRLFISFPPYGHPYGGHVSDLIGVPWVQLLFSDNDIAAAYSALAADLPDGQKRVDLRFSRDPDGRWQNTYINRMTLRRFAKIRATAPAFRCLLYREIPLRRWLLPLARLPLSKEYFVRMAVCVLERC